MSVIFRGTKELKEKVERLSRLTDFPNPALAAGENPLWWIDVDDENYRIMNSGNFETVRQKTDRTSAFTQSTAVNQPSLLKNGLGAGYDSLHTDRDNGFENIESSGNTTSGGELTVFMLFKFTALSVIPTTTLMTLYGGGGNNYNIYIQPDSSVRAGLPALASFIDSDTILVSGSVYLLAVRYSNSQNLHDMRINRVAQSQTNTAPTPLLGGNIILGNENGFPRCGTIDFGRWFLGFDKRLSDETVKIIEQGFYNYYNL